MKKFILTILILGCFIFTIDTIFNLHYKHPLNYPKLKIEHNGKNYNAKENEITWFETDFFGNPGGNSWLGDDEIKLAKDMKPIDVKEGDTLTLKLGYTENLTYLTAADLKSTYPNREEVALEINNNQIKIPSEKGEHVYLIRAFWDDTHSVTYVLKLNTN